MGSETAGTAELIERLASEIHYHIEVMDSAVDLAIWRTHAAFAFDKSVDLIAEHWRLRVAAISDDAVG